MPLYFSDIDGTLLNAEREPSPLLQTEVARLTASDHPFILISSRMPQAMIWIQEMLGIEGLPLVAYNGGLVLANNKVVHSEVIPMMIVRAVQEYMRTMSLSVQLFYADEWYVESMDYYAKREEFNTRVTPIVRPIKETVKDWEKRDIGAHKIMVMGEPEEIDDMAGFLGRVFGSRLHLYRSKDTYLEIASKSISKLTGIKMLLAAAYPDRTLADSIAFGDNYNDVEMLEGVGTGVAVENAREEVKAVANAITTGSKQDGVAKWIAEHG